MDATFNHDHHTHRQYPSLSVTEISFLGEIGKAWIMFTYRWLAGGGGDLNTTAQDTPEDHIDSSKAKERDASNHIKSNVIEGHMDTDFSCEGGGSYSIEEGRRGEEG